mmetsp:Transcript_33989/g.109805  ORF Transcript_33989/g.109805 Transcript_33989/m.109805 type:complete len:443 (+) Transcript_33989:239-1567(+)
MLHHRAVEVALHVAVRAERLADVPLSPELGVELNRLEPAHVLWREEHPAHHRLLLVAADGRAGQCDALENDAVGVDTQQRAAGHRQPGQAWRRMHRLAAREEGEQRAWPVGGRCIHCGDHLTTRLDKALQLVLGGAPVVLREDGSGREPAEARVQHERCLAPQDELRGLGGGGQREGEVDHGQPILVRVERRQDQWRVELRWAVETARGAVQLREVRRHTEHQPDVGAGRGGGVVGFLRGLFPQRLPLQCGPVLEVVNPRVFGRQVLAGVPRGRLDGGEAAVPGEPRLGRRVDGRVHLVGETSVVIARRALLQIRAAGGVLVLLRKVRVHAIVRLVRLLQDGAGGLVPARLPHLLLKLLLLLLQRLSPQPLVVGVAARARPSGHLSQLSLGRPGLLAGKHVALRLVQGMHAASCRQHPPAARAEPRRLVHVHGCVHGCVQRG